MTLEKIAPCIDISTVCPIRCKYCMHQYKGMSAPKFMPTTTFETIIGILKEEGCQKVIPYLSGEPTIHPMFWDYIKMCSDMNISTEIATRLPAKIDSSSAQKSFSGEKPGSHSILFDVTIDAHNQDTINKIILGKLDIEAVFENLSRLVEISKLTPWVTIKAYTVVNRYNENHLPEIEERVRSCGVKEWYPKSMGFYMSDIADKDDLEIVSDIFPEKGSGRFSINDGKITTKKTSCKGMLRPVISPDGDVTICCHDMIYRNTVGNILGSGSLSRILESEKFRRATKLGSKRKLPICKGCN